MPPIREVGRLRVLRPELMCLTALVLLAVAMLFSGCSKSSGSATRYHCPMHPTYVADVPGDCPICGMRLVPIDEKKHEDATEGTGAHAGQDHPPPPGASGIAGATIWTCPMDPEVVRDKPGKCPKCGMNLELKPALALGSASAGPSAATAGERRILHYRNPMDPKVTSPVPAKDSMGMDYVPVYSDEVAGQPSTVPGMVPIDVAPEGVRLAGVRTAVAQRASLSRTVRTVGTVVPDETRVRHVHTKVSGWVEKLYVSFTGESVVRGRPILTIFSQELLASQQEYLRAREAATKTASATIPEVQLAAQELLAASRRRLILLDISPSFIARLDRTGEPQRSVTMSAPSSGVVTSKSTFEGQQVEPGMELFTVTDLSRVWIEADVYENEASVVKVGQEAKLTLAYNPGVQLNGAVKYIYPYLNPQTRTLKIRFEFPNPELALKLSMYVDVELPVATSEGIIVPDSAVMDTGVRQVVFVNPREGRFEPRLVTVGVRADGNVEILRGVAEGERVVVKANFLLDSESKLRAAISGGTPASASADPGHEGHAR
ncbi:MAG: efflux RND transporter periplasmic adaptor subunit [Coriobacteriia bacterium]